MSQNTEIKSAQTDSKMQTGALILTDTLLVNFYIVDDYVNPTKYSNISVSGIWILKKGLFHVDAAQPPSELL